MHRTLIYHIFLCCFILFYVAHDGVLATHTGHFVRNDRDNRHLWSLCLNSNSPCNSIASLTAFLLYYRVPVYLLPHYWVDISSEQNICFVVNNFLRRWKYRWEGLLRNSSNMPKKAWSLIFVFPIGLSTSTGALHLDISIDSFLGVFLCCSFWDVFVLSDDFPIRLRKPTVCDNASADNCCV